jgi:putative Mg2+ transporter-C (MgtC) family protein
MHSAAWKARRHDQTDPTTVVMHGSLGRFRYPSGAWHSRTIAVGSMFSGTFETETPFLEIALRMGIAMLLGGFIGLERELKDRPAGLRTHMMVSLAAATFTLLSAELISDSTEAPEIMRIDSLRLIEAVIAGVAFLGAGAIIRAGRDVRGLTTGASLWMSGAIGVACGGGYYVIAASASVLALAVLYLLHLFEKWLRASAFDESRKSG